MVQARHLRQGSEATATRNPEKADNLSQGDKQMMFFVQENFWENVNYQ